MKWLMDNTSGRALDEATGRLFSLKNGLLVEKASLRLWDVLRAEDCFPKGRGTRMVALCGKGGNGDDTLAMLRHAFSEGFSNIVAIVASGIASEERARQSGYLRSAGVDLRTWDLMGKIEAERLLADADIILDGILGTGAKGSPHGEAAAMIESLSIQSSQAKRPYIVAVDIPSGLSDTWIEGEFCSRADLTVALEPLKLAHFLPGARGVCGRLKPVSDVFPVSLLGSASKAHHRGEGSLLTAAQLLEEADLGGLQPILDPTDYKMKRGRLAIFAGSMGGAGAARLCTKAAAASGAGYVTLYADEEILPFLVQTMESIIVKPLEAWTGEGRGCDAILAGPGWGRGAGRKVLLESLAKTGLPLILDADALRLAAEEPDIIGKAKGLIAMTPHPGEFSALAASLGTTGGLFSLSLLDEVERRFGALIVYKSHVTWIAGPEGRLAVWDGMDPGLGTAGSGDVLAGLFAGLAASAMARPSEEAKVQDALYGAARSAVIAHGLAGRTLGIDKGWFEASDLIPACAKILHDSRRPAHSEA